MIDKNNTVSININFNFYNKIKISNLNYFLNISIIIINNYKFTIINNN